MGRLRMTMSTRNLSGLAARFHALDADLQRRARRIIVDGGVETYDRARERMPYDTGFMHDHLRIKFSDQGLSYEVGWREKDFEAAGLDFYPVYVEWGTRRTPAQPSLFPANEAVRPIVRAELRKALSEAVRRNNRGRR